MNTLQSTCSNILTKNLLVMQHNFLEQADRCTENIKMNLSNFLNYAIKYVGVGRRFGSIKFLHEI